MAWLLRLVGIVAAAITFLFVTRNALNFSFVEMLVTVALIVGLVLAAGGWTMRHEA